MLGGLDVHLHFVHLVGVVFFSEAWWSFMRCSLIIELALVSCHLDLFLYTLLSAQTLEAEL